MNERPENTQPVVGPERWLAPLGDDYRKLQLDVDKAQRISWIKSLAPWAVMATFTYRWEASLFSAPRMFQKAMRKRLPGVSYFMAVEPNPGRDGFHVHALWADCHLVNRQVEWANWFKRYGRARIEPVRQVEDVSGYASKYLCKADSWFDVHLQWHRLQALRGPAFTLETPPPSSQGALNKIVPRATSSEVSDALARADGKPAGCSLKSVFYFGPSL